MKTKMLVCVLVIFVFGISTQYGNADDFDWPQWRGPNGDGISLEMDWNLEALAGGPKILWKADVETGYSNVAIKDNRLYTMGHRGRKNFIYCLNADTGHEIWKYTFQSSYEAMSTPIVDGNRVYGLGTNGKLMCLQTKNGKLLWEKNLSQDFNAQMSSFGWATSPIVDGNLLLLNANTMQIALNKKTGDLMWRIDDELPGGSWGSYASTVLCNYDGTRCALFLGPSTLNVVDVTTGKKLWSYTHGDKLHPIADPIVFDNRVFISLTNRCVMLEITGTEPKELWNNTELTIQLAPVVMVEGYLYGTHWPFFEVFVSSWDWNKMLRLDWPFRCVDAKTGTVMWEKSMETASLIAANDKLIMLGLDGALHIAEATSSSYKELSSADIFRGEKRPSIFATPPVLCNGKIYCRNYAGDLVCIDVRK